MAEISGNDIGLYVNEGTTGSPDWKLVACSTSDGFSGSTDTVTISNKCEEGFTKNLPGDKSWSFTGDAYAQTAPEANQISYDEVYDLWANGTVSEWKLESVNGASEYYRFGEAFISDLSETAASGDYLQFNLTLTGNGTVTNVEAT